MDKDIKLFNDINEIKNAKELENVSKIYLSYSNVKALGISNEGGTIYLYINKNYYKEHKKEVDDFLVSFIHSYQKDEISIGSGNIINDEFVKALCENDKIKIISLAKYGFFDKYSLSKKHYESNDRT